MADPVSTSPSFWEWLSGILWLALVTVVGIVYKRSNDDRIKTEAALEEVASKEDLKAVNLIAADAVRHQEYEQNRREIREDMGLIHTKIDSTHRELNAKIDTLTQNINTNQINIIAAIASIKHSK